MQTLTTFFLDSFSDILQNPVSTIIYLIIVILIIILMCVFDPLAILLVVATNISLQEHATPPKKDLTLQDVASIIDEPIATSVLKGLTPNNASTHGMDVVLVDKDNIRKMT